jgi:hypothetical protein
MQNAAIYGNRQLLCLFKTISFEAVFRGGLRLNALKDS